MIVYVGGGGGGGCASGKIAKLPKQPFRGNLFFFKKLKINCHKNLGSRTSNRVGRKKKYFLSYL